MAPRKAIIIHTRLIRDTLGNKSDKDCSEGSLLRVSLSAVVAARCEGQKKSSYHSPALLEYVVSFRDKEEDHDESHQLYRNVSACLRSCAKAEVSMDVVGVNVGHRGAKLFRSV